MSEEKCTTELPEDIEVIGPGQMLADAREVMKITQQQVADKLNFRITLVHNIETDNFDDALPATFNRGYLKNYAKLVNISIDEVLTAYDMLNVAQKQGAEMQSFSKQTEKQAENNMVMWISYLILAILVGSTILWWLQNAKNAEVNDRVINNTDISAKPLQAQQVVNEAVEQKKSNENTIILDDPKISTLSETLKESPNVNLSTEQLDANEESPTVQEPANDAIAILNDTEATQAESNETINLAALNLEEKNEQVVDELPVDFGPVEAAEFTFSGDCWVNIYDVTGERIAWGIKKSGYVMNISGQAPFTITLGKPELVSIKFAEETIDMAQFSRGNIAKFNLPIK